jgi:hypothetical protein
MKPCCQRKAGRSVRLASWVLPGGLLVLIPKCPACLAGYIALFTGLGIPLPVAGTLRAGLIGACVLALAWRVAAGFRRSRASPASARSA